MDVLFYSHSFTLCPQLCSVKLTDNVHLQGGYLCLAKTNKQIKRNTHTKTKNGPNFKDFTYDLTLLKTTF